MTILGSVYNRYHSKALVEPGRFVWIVCLNLEINCLCTAHLKDAEDVQKQSSSNSAPSATRVNDQVLHEGRGPALSEANQAIVPVTYQKTETGVVLTVLRKQAPPFPERRN